jgi:UDP-N-acetylmuramyl pentapeptide phosphotransferase/UDP-N-acetylglucosamine-1-phosphate transferase
LTLYLAGSQLLLDRPNERSLHKIPVPRTGGIAVLAGVLCAAALSLVGVPFGMEWAWVSAAVLPVAVVSFLDDRGEVRPLYRLAAHILAAVFLLAGGITWGQIDLPGFHWKMPDALAIVSTLLFVVWMINLYNFMDGMDGFAGGMAVFGFGSLAAAAWQADPAYALLNAIIAASAAGFLVRNFPPARIFLGDLGSATLGLLAAATSLIGAGRGLFPLWVAWLAFSPFILDATWTLLRRLARGERVWQAHRSHYYQRFVLAGWSHRKTLLWSYLLMAACGATAVAALHMTEHDQRWLLSAWATIYVAIGFRVRLAERIGRSLST